MGKKVQRVMLRVCDILELLTAIGVGIGIVVAIIALVPGFFEFWENRFEVNAFPLFLKDVLNVVIGIEFMKMLCKPSPEHIIEGLIFLMARHMVVGTTTAGEDLLSITGIAILFVLSRFMALTKDGKGRHILIRRQTKESFAEDDAEAMAKENK